MSRTRAGFLFLLAVLTLASGSLPADAQLRPPILGGGGGGGGGGGSVTNSPLEPPAGGVVIEGETLNGVTVVSDGTARAGRLGRTTRASAAAAQTPGTYRLTTRIRAANGARVDLLADDRMTGSYWVGAGWTTVHSVVHVAAGSTVGVGSWTRSGSTPSFDVDWLHVAPVAASFVTSGNQIVDPTGAPWRMRGINQADYGDPVSTDAIYAPPLEGEQVHAWGANWVRLHLSQERWLNNCPVVQEGRRITYPAAIADVVDDLTSRGVFVLLTLTSTDRGENPGCDNTPGVLFEMADQRSIPFWQQVATTFRSDPNVGFDLFNEPHDISDDIWRHGGRVVYGRTITGAQRSFDAVGMQTMYDVVRGTGATNLIIVSGQRWASDPRLLLSMPLQGYGLVAASHTYCHECPWHTPALSPEIDALNSAELRARHPLSITEAGWQHNTSGFNRQVIDWAEARGVGWGIYAWMRPKADGWPDVYSIVNSANATLDVGNGVRVRPPSMNGTPVWNALAPARTARGFHALPMAER